MSTRSTINVKMTNGDIKSIYCHNSGYPEHHVPILLEHYDTQKKAESLVNLGNLSSLNKSTDQPPGHTFDNPIDGYCVAYGRDRGEKYQQAITHRTVYEALKDRREKYNYYWNGKEWLLDGEPIEDIEHLFTQPF